MTLEKFLTKLEEVPGKRTHEHDIILIEGYSPLRAFVLYYLRRDCTDLQDCGTLINLDPKDINQIIFASFNFKAGDSEIKKMIKERILKNVLV